MQQTNFSRLVRRFCRHRVAVVCLILLVIMILMAVFAPLIAPYAPTKPTGKFSAPPSAEHLLGTDKIGRDMFSRILYAMRVSLLVGFMATVISTAIGVVLGLVSGYFGGWADRIIMSITDISTKALAVLLRFTRGIYQPLPGTEGCVIIPSIGIAQREATDSWNQYAQMDSRTAQGKNNPLPLGEWTPVAYSP
jgi:peptide/nickel transport system permease protein